MDKNIESQIPFGNYKPSSDKISVSRLDIKAIVKGKKANLSSENNKIADYLIASKSMDEIFGKDFDINVVRKDGGVSFENQAGNLLFLDPVLFDIDICVNGNVVDNNELYSHLEYKNAENEIRAVYSAQDKNGKSLFEISGLILNYYLQNEELFFELQNLINFNTGTFYLSNDKEEREKFLEYIKEKDEGIANYLENNLKEKPQRRLKV